MDAATCFIDPAEDLNKQTTIGRKQQDRKASGRTHLVSRDVSFSSNPSHSWCFTFAHQH